MKLICAAQQFIWGKPEVDISINIFRVTLVVYELITLNQKMKKGRDMKQLKITALALAITSIAASSAMAQSSKTNAWEGAFGQVSIGYESFMPASSAGTTTIPALAPYSKSVNANSSSASNANGPTANFGVGYNFGINESYVLGIGATYYPGASSAAPITVVTTLPGAPYTSGTSSTTNGTYNVKNLYSIYLAPGYVIDKDKLAYAKVGYTAATIQAYAPGSFANTTANLNGVALGLGYKQMVTNSIYLMGEVNYAMFNSVSKTIITDGGNTVNTTLKGTGLDLLVGVGYRF